uniref:Molybdopterin biosynthesis protein n=1 Tax=Inkyuleea mariana TaxID=123988 RepID=A0A4D6WZF1_9FLOR|nr:Molybdopterin biosynthesis protein [Inkyuleea mariana]
MLNPNLKYINLSKEEYKIYARHLILDNINIHGQSRLKKAKVLFIGAGGLASPALIYLAAAGIGCIGIIDYDHIELSNLNRQILYNFNHIDELKVVCAKAQIKKINPICNVIIYPSKITVNNCLRLIKNYDIVIDTSDNFHTRYIIDIICYKLHKIHIYGGIQYFEGQVSVFNYKSGPRYSDIYPKSLNLEQNNCNNLGVLGILPGIIGTLQATETIKIILGIGNILNGYILIYNALEMSFKKIKIKPIKKNISSYILQVNNTSIVSIKNLTRTNKKNTIIIDIRQENEFKESHIHKAFNIPIKYLTQKNTINFIINNFLKNKIIIYCKQQSRTIIASNILNKNNIQHTILDNRFIE